MKNLKTWDTENEERLLHYSQSPFTLDYEEEYPEISPTERFFSMGLRKPRGLWVSVDEAWKEWSEMEEFNLDSLQSVQRVEVKEDNNILWISNEEEFDEFTKAYIYKSLEEEDLKRMTEKLDLPLLEFFNEQRGLDWARVKEDYSGIIISPMLASKRFQDGVFTWYYGWDVPSGCIWGLNDISSFEECED